MNTWHHISKHWNFYVNMISFLLTQTLYPDIYFNLKFQAFIAVLLKIHVLSLFLKLHE